VKEEREKVFGEFLERERGGEKGRWCGWTREESVVVVLVVE